LGLREEEEQEEEGREGRRGGRRAICVPWCKEVDEGEEKEEAKVMIPYKKERKDGFACLLLRC